MPLGLLVGSVLDGLGMDRKEILRRNDLVKKFAKDVTSRHAKARIRNYQIYDQRQQELKNLCIDVGRRIRAFSDEGRNLFLFGKTGTGKDHVCVALMIHAVNQGISCRWIDCQAVLFPSVQRGESIESQLSKTQIVCLSDPVVPGTTDANRKCLFRLINRRWSQGLSTWVTCNLTESLSQGPEMFGERTITRLLDRAQKVYCGWDDFRTLDQ